MNIGFRNCKYNDVEFILKLKELCFKWYIEIIYGWDINIQREKTINELDDHINDMRIITLDNKDIGITTFYEEEETYIVGMIIIHPDYQNKGVGAKLIKHIDSYIISQIPNGWSVCVELMSAKNKEDFYSKFGFEPRPSQWRGAGMFKFLRNE